jgi:HK97 family phage major capsid protein
MKYAETLRAEISVLDQERAALKAEAEQIDADETRTAEQRDARIDEILARNEAIQVEKAEKEARAAKLEALEAERIAAPTFIRKTSPVEVFEDRSATPQQLADAVTRSLEPRVEDAANMDHVRKVVLRHKADTDWARGLLLRSTDVYESAWAKVITGRGMQLTAEERTALSTMTSANGDYLVPTHLDPTIILTNNGSSNVMRQHARIATLTRPGDTSWQGITSAGVTASFDAQLAEVSDDSPTFGQPTVAVHKAQALIQASIEATEDIAGLGSELLMLFADAKDRLEGAAHMTGSGTNEPWGLFSALDANTNVEIVSDTAASLFKADLDEVYLAVPVRFRGKSKWVMNPTWALAIQNLGTAVSANYTTDLTAAPSNRILGKEVVETDDAPATATTTVRDNRLVFGDLSNYLIVDKPGSFSVEYIPHLFNTNANLPDGRRAWYAHWRTGGDSINDVAFRLLQDKTSA